MVDSLSSFVAAVKLDLMSMAEEARANMTDAEKKGEEEEEETEFARETARVIGARFMHEFEEKVSYNHHHRHFH